MLSRKYKFIIAAGGTGGHVLPGLSIYHLLKAENHMVKFICRKKDYDFIEDLKSIKNDLVFFSGIGMRRKLTVKNLLFIYYLLINFIKTSILFMTFGPDAVIGMGGYITFPVLLVSFILKIPFFLCEQNSYPGIVNRIFGPYARTVFVNFKYSSKFFPKSMLTGNPIRPQLKKNINLNAARKFFKFNKHRKVLLVMGGSQGALKINSVFERIIPQLNKYNIIWLAGSDNFKLFKKYQQQANIRIFGYLKNMNYAFRAADLAVSRAGAMSISELSYFGVPVIFIPLAQSADNHQYINAKIVVQSGGGQLIEEKFLNENTLRTKINSMMTHPPVLLKYRKNIRKIYQEDSENKIVNEIYNKLTRKR